jgi:hypothetical protein
MKAILKFNLPEEQEEFLMAQQGREYYLLIQDLFSELRSKMKHGCGEFAYCEGDTIETMQKWLINQLQERNLPLD